MTTPPLPPTLAEAVLGYLGVTPGPPALALLDALVAAYTRTVPWESATRIVKRAATADVAACPRWPQEFWTDAVQRGAGGTCFESNYAFFSLLRALGYDGYLTVNDMGNTAGCHTAIVVMLAGERWLVDVGLPLHTPLPLHPTLATSRRSPFHTYTVYPRVEGRYSVERDVHS